MNTNTNAFILNDTAKKDVAVQIAIANYTKHLEREHQQRNVTQPHPTTVWSISDRD